MRRKNEKPKPDLMAKTANKLTAEECLAMMKELEKKKLSKMRAVRVDRNTVVAATEGVFEEKTGRSWEDGEPAKRRRRKKCV